MGFVALECPCCGSDEAVRRLSETDFACETCGEEWVDLSFVNEGPRSPVRYEDREEFDDD